MECTYSLVTIENQLTPRPTPTYMAYLVPSGYLWTSFQWKPAAVVEVQTTLLTKPPSYNLITKIGSNGRYGTYLDDIILLYWIEINNNQDER